MISFSSLITLLSSPITFFSSPISMMSADQCSITLFRTTPSGTEDRQNQTLYIQDRIANGCQQWSEWLEDGSDLGYKSGADLFVVFPMKCTAAGGSGAREELFTAAATAALTPPRGSLAARGIGAASNVPIPPDTRDFRQNGTGAFRCSMLFLFHSHLRPKVLISRTASLASLRQLAFLFAVSFRPSIMRRTFVLQWILYILQDKIPRCQIINNTVKLFWPKPTPKDPWTQMEYSLVLGLQLELQLWLLLLSRCEWIRWLHLFIWFWLSFNSFLWRRHRQGGRCGGKYSYSYSAINNGDNVWSGRKSYGPKEQTYLIRDRAQNKYKLHDLFPLHYSSSLSLSICFFHFMFYSIFYLYQKTYTFPCMQYELP